MRKTLSWDMLEGMCAKENLTAYLCHDSFDSVKRDVKKDNPDINSFEHKCETMARIIYDNIDFKSLSEEHDTEEKSNAESRWNIADKIAEEWVYGNVKNITQAQSMCDESVAAN